MVLPEIIRDLLENGVHFGHLSKHWSPKMKQFIFGKKKNIYIIDLEKTAQKIEESKDFLKKIASEGKKILFVATKRQLKEVIEQFAISCQMPYIVERWIGGFLTNFSTIRSRIDKYIELREKKEKGELGKVSNKELLRINRELEKMEKNYRGVVSLESLPACIYIVDPKREVTAVREARKLNIPIVALIDTDSDPEVIDYPIPGNDDAIKSVSYITRCLVEAIKEGMKDSVDSNYFEGDNKDTEESDSYSEENTSTENLQSTS